MSEFLQNKDVVIRAEYEKPSPTDFPRQLDYWRTQLADVPSLLELPGDYSRHLSPILIEQQHSFQIPGELCDAAQRFSQEEGVTLFMTLLTAFQIVLYRYSGQEDIVVGAPANWPAENNGEEKAGQGSNLLALRVRMQRTITFRMLVQQVRRCVEGAYAHGTLPFAYIARELQLTQDQERYPLLQVLFALQPAPASSLHLSNFTIHPYTTCHPDLLLYIQQTENGLCGQVLYKKNLFTTTTVERMAWHWQTTLADALHSIDKPLGMLNLLTAQEQQQIFSAWNSTQRLYPDDRYIHELFEEQVLQRPDAVAVCFGEEAWTYTHLNRQADQLAYALRSRGVGAETLVGLCVERSYEMVVGLLGILKAGGAYVPLDPSYPEERLAFILADTGTRLVLGQQHLLERLSHKGVELLCLDYAWTQPTGVPTTNPQDCPAANHLAYVLYTSGSTGTPKGVAVSHRSVARLVKNNWYARLDEREVLLHFAPLAFDASTFEIWGSLLNGARLVIAPAQRLSLEELGAVVQEQRVSTLWLTAGLFHQMVDEYLQGLRGVRQLLAGGEALSPGHVRKVLEQVPGCQVINGYGPTECTTFACCYPVQQLDEEQTSVSIGHPIANTQAYVLDAQMQPVPIGVTGELYLGGAGLARGYLGRPELTAEKFVPDPWSGQAGARLYRTGDQVRYREDGTIEFVGRQDQQVKIRGFRIEPGEIEAVLQGQAGVRECAVVVREEKRGEKQLVAYVVSEPGQEVSSQQLRVYVSERLPAYMVPTWFVPLPSLPLTPNGKLDRHALPAPDNLLSASLAGFISPRNVLEEVLAQIWSSVLHLKQVSVNTPFFELGGDSLALTRIISRLSKIFHIPIPLSFFFDGPTICEVAHMLVENEPSPGQAQKVAHIIKKVKALSPAEKQDVLINTSHKKEV